jgi:hypothetical protein
MRSKVLNLTQRLFSNFARSSLLLLTTVSGIYLLFYYYDSGELRDAGVYYDSGLAVLGGENPYVASRWGSFGPVPFSILLSIVPIDAQATFVRILSILGVYFFYRVFFPDNRPLAPLAIPLILIWLSPFRELLVTNQISGIAIGLVALGVKFLNEYNSFRDVTPKVILGTLFFSMALDLKPHITIFFFLGWVIYHRSFAKFSIVALLLVASHLLINLSQMRILELDWFLTIKELNKSAAQSNLGDSLSFWPILNYFWPASPVYHALSIFVPICLSILCFYFAYKGKRELMIVISFFIPATSSYYHYYDMVPLCVVFLVSLFRISNLLLTSFTVSFILIPKEYLSVRNQLLIILIVGIFVVRTKMQDKEKPLKKVIIPVFLGLTFSYFLHLFNTSLELSPYLLQSLIVTESLIMILGVYYYTKKKNIPIT